MKLLQHLKSEQVCGRAADLYVPIMLCADTDPMVEQKTHGDLGSASFKSGMWKHFGQEMRKDDGRQENII